MVLAVNSDHPHQFTLVGSVARNDIKDKIFLGLDKLYGVAGVGSPEKSLGFGGHVFFSGKH